MSGKRKAVHVLFLSLLLLLPYFFGSRDSVVALLSKQVVLQLYHSRCSSFPPILTINFKYQCPVPQLL